MTKKGIFGLVGAVLLFLVIFIIIAILLFYRVSFAGFGEPLKLHLIAEVKPADYSPFCDMYLMNTLRFEDINTNQTYSELITLAHENKTLRQNVTLKFADVFINNGLESKGERYFGFSATGEHDLEPFIAYGVECSETLTKNYCCYAYIPAKSPEDGYIIVELVLKK